MVVVLVQVMVVVVVVCWCWQWWQCGWGDHTKWRAWQEVGYGRHHAPGRWYLCGRPCPCLFSSGVHVVFPSQSHIGQGAVRAASLGPCAGTLRWWAPEPLPAPEREAPLCVRLGGRPCAAQWWLLRVIIISFHHNSKYPT